MADEAADRFRALGDRYLTALDLVRDVSMSIAHEMGRVAADGGSLAELSEASGLTVAQIEYIFMVVDVQRHVSARTSRSDW